MIAADPAFRRHTAIGLAAAAGLAWAAAAPPRGWWPLLPLGIAALATAVRDRSLRDRLFLGAVTGVALYLPSLWWMTGFTVVGYVAIALLETAMLAIAVGVLCARRLGGWWALPAALVLLEAIQTRFPFGGFPLTKLVFSQVGGPFAFAAPLGGELLVIATAATAGLALAAMIVAKHARPRLLAVALAAAGAAFPVGLGALINTEPVGKLDAAVVQGGGPRGLRAVFTDPQATTDRQLAVAETITGSPDLVLLAENVVSLGEPIAGTPIGSRIGELARSLASSIVVGVTEREGDGFRNVAVLWGPDGRRLDRYEKEHRVPFGEYIPGRALLERFTDLTALVPRDAIVGQGEASLRSPAAALAVAISYEVFFADRVREGVAAGGQLLIVPTNAASYATDEVPAIELAAAQLRAREFGRTVLQAAPTGYSAVVLADGRVVARSELGAPALLRQVVPLRTGTTPYAQLGDIPVLLLAALVVAVLSTLRSRERRPQPVGGSN